MRPREKPASDVRTSCAERRIILGASAHADHREIGGEKISSGQLEYSRE